MPAGEKGDDWLMVLGGQAADEPDMLTKLPLVAHATGRTMPWFGTIKGFALASVLMRTYHDVNGML